MIDPVEHWSTVWYLINSRDTCTDFISIINAIIYNINLGYIFMLLSWQRIRVGSTYGMAVMVEIQMHHRLQEVPQWLYQRKPYHPNGRCNGQWIQAGWIRVCYDWWLLAGWSTGSEWVFATRPSSIPKRNEIPCWLYSQQRTKVWYLRRLRNENMWRISRKHGLPKNGCIYLCQLGCGLCEIRRMQ